MLRCADGEKGYRLVKIRQKPVVVDTEGRWFQMGDNSEVIQYTDSVSEEFCKVPGCGDLLSCHGWIQTLEGGHIVCPGDWIVVGVKGERYPVKPDIFDLTYDRNWTDSYSPTLLALCKDILELAEHGDYSNGNEFYGVDEGRVLSGNMLDGYRKKLEEFEKEATK